MEHGTEHIGAHQVGQFAGWTFNLDTLYMTWITMVVVIIVAVAATRRLEMIPRSKMQNAIEMVVLALLDQLDSSIGPKGRKIAPLIITLFLFLIIANWMGLVPGFTSPTNDINTTLGLAVLVGGMSHILGMANRGIFKYLGHFFKPSIFFLPINIIEALSKPVTLAARLFGNILAGEILIIILTLLVPYVIPTIWLGFSVFVGIVQALIFTIMSISYLADALSDEQH